MPPIRKKMERLAIFGFDTVSSEKMLKMGILLDHDGTMCGMHLVSNEFSGLHA